MHDSAVRQSPRTAQGWKMVRLPESLYERIRQLAYVERRTITAQIETLLERALQDIEVAA